MSLSPVSYIAPNYRDYQGWWLKAYVASTTTPKAISLDASGNVQVAKLQLNANGFIVSAGGAIVTPYIAGIYDAYLFPNEESADNNNTTNAIRVANNIIPLTGEFADVVIYVKSVAAIPEVNSVLRPQIMVENYHLNVIGGGGVFYWDAGKNKNTHNGGTVIDPDKTFPTSWANQSEVISWFAAGSGLGCWVRQYEGLVSVNWFGAVGNCVTNTTVGNTNYNPATSNGYDNTLSFQKAIDVATALKTSVTVEDSVNWYKIVSAITVTCGLSGGTQQGSKLKFPDLGTSFRSTYAFEIVDAKYAIFSNFSFDGTVSADPEVWTNNYDNFTGRRGIRSYGTSDRQEFKNITITNVNNGIGFYGGPETVIINNINISRCRGNFGDGIYMSGGKQSCKITNCAVSDFTRIGLVQDSPDGGIIQDNVVENCYFTNGHDSSVLHGGGEFNSGIWLEQTARSVIRNCTSYDTGARGFVVTTGGRALEIAGYTECYSLIDGCIAEDCGSGFVTSQLGTLPANHRVTNCTSLNCQTDDITGDCKDGTLNVYIDNFYSEHFFTQSQSRVFNFSSDRANGVIRIVIDGAKIKSDFDPATFNFNSNNGHIATFSNSGIINYNVSNLVDDNGVLLNLNHGPFSGVFVIQDTPNLYVNSVKSKELNILRCGVNRLLSVAGTKFYAGNSVFNSGLSLTTNTDIVFDYCTFNVPDDGRVWISNNNASINEPNAIVARFSNCNFYKNYLGSTPYSIQFSTKANPNTTGIVLSNNIFYNTSNDGDGGYPIFFNAGFAHFLGMNYLDNTVEFTSRSGTNNSTATTNMTKLALQ